jgi:hypothetical protein
MSTYHPNHQPRVSWLKISRTFNASQRLKFLSGDLRTLLLFKIYRDVALGIRNNSISAQNGRTAGLYITVNVTPQN